MKNKTGHMYLISGIVIGAFLFGGSAAIAAGVAAQPKTAAVIIDGCEADLKGYVIDGAHYFQLRDLSASLGAGGKDFSIDWDGAGRRVLIDTSRGYNPDEAYAGGVDAPPPPQGGEAAYDAIKAEIVRLANIERAKAGLQELQALPALMECAQAKADDMMANGYFGHTSPGYGSSGSMIRAFVPDAIITGENLTARDEAPAEAIASWMSSPGHRATMLNPGYTHIGIGCASLGTGQGFLWVQQFVELR